MNKVRESSKAEQTTEELRDEESLENQNSNSRKLKPPFPAQTQEKPGIEAELSPRPLYEAPGYRGSKKLDGKVALITGGDSGIGRATAVLYAREGAKVAITYLESEDEDAKQTCEAIKNEDSEALSVACDVSKFENCCACVATVMDKFGKLDILVNNAAYQQHIDGIDDLSIDQWDKTFKTNIYGYFYMTKAALCHLKEGSAIVNTGSITGLEGSENLLDYSSTKGAIHAFTKSLAKKLVAKGIRVNCVAPGPVWTPLNVADQSPEKVARFGASTKMGRPAQPEEIAPTFVFLASNIDSSYITGEIIALLGGDVRAG